MDNNSAVNGSGESYVFYAFANIQGYSKINSYIGNGSATNSSFIYTGFKPAITLIKRTNLQKWVYIDNKRNPINGATGIGLKPDAPDADESFSGFNVDFLSNGFKPYSSWSGYNTSGETYIYMCFASNPFVSSTGVPATAR